MFNKLKETLVKGGYRVVLTDYGVPKGKRAKQRLAKGYIEPDSLKIYINKNLGLNDRVITLVHELLHEIFPAWGERRVEREAGKTFNRLNIDQLGFLQFFVMTPLDTKNFLAGRLSPKRVRV